MVPDLQNRVPRKVLIVDDDPSISKLLSIALSSEGYEVYEALNGIKGYKVARREKPDIVLLDIMMPDVDGFEVFRRIKLDPTTNRIPVLFVSAKSSREDVRKGLSMGAEGYITKPFKISCLLDKVNEVVG
ncbi:MAG: response regulator [Actinobacteria bacterium]|nr:response regulator [Actinomycetota bacterium]